MKNHVYLILVLLVSQLKTIKNEAPSYILIMECENLNTIKNPYNMVLG